MQNLTTKRYSIGYTSGVFDLFHIGHLNIFKNAKEYCDKLIVGVSTDNVVLKNKNKKPVISFEDRIEIVQSIKYVDETIPQEDYSIEYKIKKVKEIKANVLFVGSDWQGTDKWNKLEKELSRIGCDVIYLPHTDGISTTDIIKQIKSK